VGEKMPGQTDPAIRARALRARVPAVVRIDFGQVLAGVEPRHGPCWSELSPVHRSPVEMRYSLRGWNPIAGTEHAEGLEELVARGWTRIYRAPQGEGVGRRASFTAIDLSYGPELRCRCAGVGDAVEESKSDVSLRFRWERGKMFEVSATGGARHTGLSPAITAGHLVTYDFAAEGSFPGESRAAAALMSRSPCSSSRRFSDVHSTTIQSYGVGSLRGLPGAPGANGS